MRIEYQLFFMQGNFFLFVRIHFLLFFGFVYKIYQKKKKKKFQSSSVFADCPFKNGTVVMY